MLMKMILSVFSLILISSETIFSQSKSTSHAFQFQLEVLGPGASSSFNIDSRLGKKDNGIGFRVGVGITPLGWLKDACNSGSLNSFPIGVNYLIGKGEHLFEVAGGGVLLFTSGTKLYCVDNEKNFFSEETTSYWFTSVGYRYQRVRKKGMTYRLFVAPLFQKDFPVKFWGGGSIGYRF
jgi:hypothetical protein